jgi:intracellular septation protein A
MDVGLLLLQTPRTGFRPVYYRLAYVVSHWIWLVTLFGALTNSRLSDRFMQWTVSIIRFSEGCALQAELAQSKTSA